MEGAVVINHELGDTKVNWLVRQLKQTNDRARLECNVMNQRGNGASDLLGRVRENPELLILDPTKTIRSFTVALNSSMGLKSARCQGSFVDGLLAAIDTFYGEVLQSLKAWAAKPPRMREQTDTSVHCDPGSGVLKAEAAVGLERSWT